MSESTGIYREQHANGARPHPAIWGDGPKLCMIYFIQAGDNGLVKIGSAKDAKKRLAALQIACPIELRLAGLFYARRDTEKYLHWLFRAERVRGEWFTGCPDLLAFIEREAQGRLYDWGMGRRKTKPDSGLCFYVPTP